MEKKYEIMPTKWGEFRCFTNNKIKINSTLKIHLSSGNATAQNRVILVVPHNTVNLMGRDILQKLGIHLSQTFSKISTHLCTRLGNSKNHIAKFAFKQYFKPTQHKGRRVPIRLIDKDEKI